MSGTGRGEPEVADLSLRSPEERYRAMLLIRRFEERIHELGPAAVAGSVHYCGGQEAIPVGVVAALDGRDRVVATYRGHGWALAKGAGVIEVLAEVCHRSGGLNGGRAGSAMLSAPSVGFIGETAIVGAGLPIADGLALAAQLRNTGGVVAVSFGDGAIGQGATHEGLVFAAAKRLPVVFVCENNDWSEMTSTAAVFPDGSIAERAASYGMRTVSVDGSDPELVFAAAVEAVAGARAGHGPILLECRAPRLMGHYNRDVEHYRTAESRDADRTRDPLVVASRRQGLDAAATVQFDHEVCELLDRAVEAVLAMPLPDPATATEHVIGAPEASDTGRPEHVDADLTYGEAVNAALADALDEDSDVIVFGEDIGVAGGVFGVTRRLQRRFGEARVFDTPIAENAILGAALGAALEGLSPIVEIMWADFLLVALDQVVNQAANVRFISNGRSSAPLTVRTQQGATPGSCAQHAQSLEAILAHIPGVNVGLPATPQDAYSMLRAAQLNPDPCVIIEARSLYQQRGDVRRGGVIEPVGGARIRRSGRRLAIVTWGTTVQPSLEAADRLAGSGIECTVVDLRWLAPLDEATIAQGLVDAGGRVLIVHEANTTGGFGAEVAARIAERHFDELDAPIMRLGAADTRIPAAPVLQQAVLPSTHSIEQAARRLASV